MQDRPVEILLVEPDTELATLMQDCLSEAVACRVTCVVEAAAALREELTTHHDVLLLSADLPDANWLDLVREIRVSNDCPVIVLSEAPSTEDVLNAMRAGVTDVLLKPFELTQMCSIVQQAADRSIRRQRSRARYRRLRRLTNKIVRERRDLRHRIDLICRDFVHAYRRLAQRVSDADLLPRK